MAIPKKPKLLYQVTIERKRYFRRFSLALLVSLTAFLALIALNIIRDQGTADETVLLIGIFVAAVLAAIFFVRAVFSLGRWLGRRNETLRIFDQGFVWIRSGQESKYSWSALNTYREGGHGIYFRDKPLSQWGAHTLKMEDGRVFKVSGIYGDLRKLNGILQRPAARVTGVHMGKALRDEQAVKLNSQLTVWPGGVQVGKQEIHWSDLDVRLKGKQLMIYRKNQKGKFSKVRQFNVRRVDNVGGFMEVATTTIRSHQRERFGIYGSLS
jgi:hypothetical protein